MTDNNVETPKITSVEKTNDPRRVAAGKRLAEISKQAKEKKMRDIVETEYKSEPGYERIAIVVGFIGLSIVVHLLTKKSEQPNDKQPAYVPETPTTKGKLDNFD